MAVTQGMNVQAVLEIAGHLDTDREKVADLVHRTQLSVNTLAENWHGPDSSQFLADWHSHSKQLSSAADAIAHMSKSAKSQAHDQKAASAH